MSNIILLNKPFHVLSQFSDDQGRATLKDFIPGTEGFRPAGRLDYDSEGLLILTNDGKLQQQIANPEYKLLKTYWVQVEGDIEKNQLQALASGVQLKDGLTLPAKVKTIGEPALWPRNPPIRERKNIPTHWLELSISEGKNRQVRRMTAAVGLPTLRLIRYAIGPWTLGSMLPGDFRREQVHLPNSVRRNKSQAFKPATTSKRRK